ncbi:MAG: hypothetical protein J6T08_04665, partial [Lentisphaeria bacterium]|nr:hypothetical protein [Lentisphaeria bacterium]
VSNAGGAVLINSGEATFNNTVFSGLYYRADGTFGLNDGTNHLVHRMISYYGNTGSSTGNTGRGGAIIMLGSGKAGGDLTLTNTRFEGIASWDQGGGIYYANNDGDITMTNIVVDNVVSGARGDANNDDGGFLFANAKNIYVNVDTDVAAAGNGHAVSETHSVNTFTNIDGRGSGGVFYVYVSDEMQFNGDVRFENITFQQNDGRGSGGVIYFRANSAQAASVYGGNLTFNGNATFINIEMDRDSYKTGTDANWVTNWNGGGLIKFMGQDLSFLGSSFTVDGVGIYSSSTIYGGLFQFLGNDLTIRSDISINDVRMSSSKTNAQKGTVAGDYGLIYFQGRNLYLEDTGAAAVWTVTDPVTGKGYYAGASVTNMHSNGMIWFGGYEMTLKNIYIDNQQAEFKEDGVTKNPYYNATHDGKGYIGTFNMIYVAQGNEATEINGAVLNIQNMGIANVWTSSPNNDSADGALIKGTAVMATIDNLEVRNVKDSFKAKETKYRDAGMLYFTTASQVTITNSLFDRIVTSDYMDYGTNANNATRGGIIANNRSTVTIKDTVFSNNAISNPYGMINTYLGITSIYGTAQADGTASTRFENNTNQSKYLLGALVAGVGSTVTIHGENIYNADGTVKYYGISMTGNTANVTNGGNGYGFIYGGTTTSWFNNDGNEAASRPSVTIDGLYFNDNTFVRTTGKGNIYGGAINFCGGNDNAQDAENPLTIRNSHFENASATTGGVILIGTGSTVNIDSSIFVNNRSFGGAGGVIRIDSGVHHYLNINNSVFRNNSASTTGGVYWGGGFAELYGFKVTNSVFENNHADSGVGGAFTFMVDEKDPYPGHNRTPMIFENNVFRNNWASSHGGAIYMGTQSWNTNSYYSYNQYVELTSNLFEGNWGGYTSVDGLTFTASGDANTRGGAVSYLGNTIYLTDNIWRNNRTTGSGGALYYWGRGSGGDLDYSTQGNSSLTTHVVIGRQIHVEGEIYEGNYAVTNGGALFINWTAGDFTHVLNVNNSTFYNNSTAGKGGAIYANSRDINHYITLYNSTFHRNQATHGGVLFFNTTKNDKSSLVILSSTFDGNITTNAASGTLDTQMTRIIHIASNIFTNNEAAYELYMTAKQSGGTTATTYNYVDTAGNVKTTGHVQLRTEVAIRALLGN